MEKNDLILNCLGIWYNESNGITISITRYSLSIKENGVPKKLRPISLNWLNNGKVVLDSEYTVLIIHENLLLISKTDFVNIGKNEWEVEFARI